MKQKPLLVLLLCLAWPAQMVVSWQHSLNDYAYFGEAVHLPNCENEEVKVATGAREENYNSFGFHEYRDKYITLYYKCICRYVVLTTGQRLNVHLEPGTVKSITFKDSTIPLIPVGVFTSFINLTELYLNDNLVNSIHPGAFTGLTKLEELYLQNNNITTVSKGILNSLPHLNILNLSNNAIEIIEENSFLGLFSLNKIYLNNNKLKELMPDMFHKLNYLNVIDLSHNLLTDIPLNLFPDFIFNSDYNFIGLSYNNFTTIDFSVFPENLECLTLGNNRINSIKNWTRLQGVRDLDLSNNALKDIETLHETLLHFNLSGNLIEELNNSFFLQTKTLSALDLSQNLIKIINEDTFVGVDQLANLFLENNQITNVPIGCFRDLQSLRVLNLSNNEITEFEYGTFAGLSALETLDISGNKLAYLYESSFHDLKQLQILNIKDNLITSFDPHDLIDHSNHLKTVALNNNPWVCKSLLNIVKTLEKGNVSVVKGSTEKTAHVHGIACVNYNFNDNSPNFENKSENAALAKFYAISSEMNAMKKFFNKDFRNSSFYKYFENFNKFNSTPNFNISLNSEFLKYFDNGFKNTTFYKYFEEDLSNISFLVRFDAAFQKLSKTLNSLDVDFKNSSFYKFVNSGNVAQNFSKSFDDGFKNSGFYKYFTKEFSNSEFFKYFDKTLQAKIDSNLLKIRNYFNNDFSNSTFSRFFDHVNRFNSNFIDRSELSSNYARLIDNKEDITSKLSELIDTIKIQENEMQSARTGSAIFMTIVVIMLLAITLLLAFNHIRTRFKRNLCKPVSENTSESQMQIADEMELMSS